MRMHVVFAWALVVSGGEALFAQTEPTYWQDIRPIFRKHCTVCHSAKNLKETDVSGGLALDTLEAIRKGSTQPVLGAKSAASLLVKLLETADVKKRMPLDANPLPAETIALIRRWVDTGAREGKPADEAPEAKSVAKSSPGRKLDVLLTTSATPPANLVGAKAAGKLDLALKIGPLAPVTALAFSPDNKLLAAGGYGQVAVWDLGAAKPGKVLTNVLGAVNDLKFSPDGKVLAVAGGQPSAQGDVRFYQVGDWKLLNVLRGHEDVVFAVAFSRDGKRLASASFDHSVRLWDVAGQSLKTYPSHSDFVYAVSFSPDGKYLASAGKDRIVKLVETETGKSVFTFSGMEQDVMALAFSPDGKNVVSSGFETGIYWWNPQTGERTKVQGGHGVAVHELAFSADGKRLVSAAADRTVRIWDGAAGTVLKTLPVGSIAYAAAISANNKLVASGSFDGLTRLWDEASGRQLVTFLAFAGAGEQPEWLAVTPEGFAAGSDKMLAQGQWRMAGSPVQGQPIWSILRQPELVSRAARGEALTPPKFDGKQ